MKLALIRADGSSKLGMGHLTRTIDLANELKKKNYSVTFLTKYYLEGISLIKKNGFNLIELNPRDEIREIVKILDFNNKFFDIILVDLQHIKDQEDIHYLKKYCTKLYLISDDISPLYMDVDAIFAITVNQEEINYRNIKNTKYYTGLKYFPLNRKFKAVSKKTIKKEVSNILLTFGGADPKNYSNILINILKKMNLKVIITLIIGPAFPNELFEKIFINKPETVIIIRNSSNMIKYYFEADLCICSAGNTVIELLTCGVPCIVLPQTETV